MTQIERLGKCFGYRLVKRLELGFRKAQKKTGKQSWKDFENDLDGKTCKKNGKKNWKDLEKNLERLKERT